MSATISENKLKFSVFGRGFEDERSDSGEGAKSDYRDIGHGCSSAIIDSTDTYFWFAQTTGSFPFEYCAKRRLSDLQSMGQTIIPDDRTTYLFHPSNVTNNYGVAIQDGGQNVYVFDMADDTVYHHITSAYTSFSQETCDCIMVDDKIFLCQRTMSNVTNKIWCIDLTNETFSEYGSFGAGSAGFVDNDTIFGFYTPEWFYQNKVNYGFSLSGGTQWSVTAPVSGASGFPNCSPYGLTANGFLYLPVYMHSSYRFGMFKGNAGSDFQTPKPIRTFGKFEHNPSVETSKPPYYTEERTRAVFSCTDGLFVTDYKDITLIVNENWYPKCIGNKYILARNYFNNTTRIFEYR